MTIFFTLPALMILAAIVAGFGQIHRLHVQADRENADGELIAQAHRIEHRQRLERQQPTLPGRRDTAP